MQTYVFRYPNPRPSHVYYPSNGGQTFYSVPFYSREQSATRNTLMFYQCESQVPAVDGAIKIARLRTEDAIEYGRVLRMPVAIFLAAHCDLEERAEVHDIYYAYYPSQPYTYKEVKTG